MQLVPRYFDDWNFSDWWDIAEVIIGEEEVKAIRKALLNYDS